MGTRVDIAHGPTQGHISLQKKQVAKIVRRPTRKETLVLPKVQMWVREWPCCHWGEEYSDFHRRTYCLMPKKKIAGFLKPEVQARHLLDVETDRRRKAADIQQHGHVAPVRRARTLAYARNIPRLDRRRHATFFLATDHQKEKKKYTVPGVLGSITRVGLPIVKCQAGNQEEPKKFHGGCPVVPGHEKPVYTPESRFLPGDQWSNRIERRPSRSIAIGQPLVSPYSLYTLRASREARRKQKKARTHE